VTVVDDLSSDDTVSVSESLGARVCRLSENSGPSRARNVGAAEARGEYLFFIDADVRIHPGAVWRAVRILDEDPSAAAVFGSYDDRPQARGLPTEYKNLLHHFVHQTGKRQASTFWSGCGAIRRSVFHEVGGFDEIGFPRCIEDIELGYRLRAAGHRILLDRKLQGTHLKRWSLRSWITTDICCRAIPWAQLNLERRVAPDDLNIAWRQKLSVLLTAIGATLVALAPFQPWLLAGGVLAALAVVGLNWRLFDFFRRVRGLRFALACVPLHLFYFLFSGLSFAVVWVAFRAGLQVPDGNAPRT